MTITEFERQLAIMKAHALRPHRATKAESETSNAITRPYGLEDIREGQMVYTVSDLMGKTP